MADADLRARVVALLEQHGITTVAALAPIFEHGNKHVYRADLVDGHAVVVRVFPATRPIVRVRGDLAVLAHAVAAGISAERPIAALELDGRGVAVTEYIAGSRPARAAEDLRQLGDIAGRLSALAPCSTRPFRGWHYVPR